MNDPTHLAHCDHTVIVFLKYIVKYERYPEGREFIEDECS